ncbi:MAG: ABC transporter permease [Muribaculaceae bacterium]|nr:ABC transporter permease [Muribaculaceae bacterium]MBQ2399554.1 ABC transporter permease [Muribaculaceae bacterium]MBQ5724132.1 ABC transporter permease [Muribaculaceae bacterium]MEE1366449.1 ABC transporter permease [Muribaculaceae bacterium]
MKSFILVFKRSVRQLASRRIYWLTMVVMPLFCMIFLTDLLREGLPIKAPAAVVDYDRSELSRRMIQSLNGAQMSRITAVYDNIGDARRAMQRGEIYGFYLIPENFQSDLLSVRTPTVSYYTNMAYYVPASLLYKNFTASALYAKADVLSGLLTDVGVDAEEIVPLLQPINIEVRGLSNPWLDYAVYLCNSFVPAIMQLMIFLTTAFAVCQEMKRATSPLWLRLAKGSVIRALSAKLLPQTIGWQIMMLFMLWWFYGKNGFVMNGSWGWMILSEMMFVLACQGFALFVVGVLPNLRLALSVGALVGVLSFSIGAFSFPYESMYGSIGVFSWLVPVRYNFLIYIDQALNGIDVYYSRIFYVAYIVFMLLPLLVIKRLKRELLNPVYVP